MPRELTVTTPDGSNQAVHPDVVDSVDGFSGWRYWMACTPYPFGNDRLENPVIRVSEDGVHWEVPDGAPDPVVPAPADARRHWSDTDLTLHEGRLYLVFRGCERGSPDADFLVTSSSDGRVWSEPEMIWSGRDGLSPALHVDDAGWVMWHIRCSTRSAGVPVRLVVHRGPSLGEWGAPEELPLVIPGHVPWHLDVQQTPEGFEALVAAYPVGTNPSRCVLFHLTSADGRSFHVSDHRPVLRPSWSRWNNRMVYRSTFVKEPGGHYRIWYSGASWGMRCGIGLAEGPLSALTLGPGPGRSVSGPARVREDVVGWASYVAQHRLPPRLRRVLRRLVS